jgi:hypothetical protein
MPATTHKTVSEVQAHLEHKVCRSLRIKTYVIIVTSILLEICTPKPCVGVIHTIEEVVHMERE